MPSDDDAMPRQLQERVARRRQQQTEYEASIVRTSDRVWQEAQYTARTGMTWADSNPEVSTGAGIQANLLWAATVFMDRFQEPGEGPNTQLTLAAILRVTQTQAERVLTRGRYATAGRMYEAIQQFTPMNTEAARTGRLSTDPVAVYTRDEESARITTIGRAEHFMGLVENDDMTLVEMERLLGVQESPYLRPLLDQVMSLTNDYERSEVVVQRLRQLASTIGVPIDQGDVPPPPPTEPVEGNLILTVGDTDDGTAQAPPTPPTLWDHLLDE